MWIETRYPLTDAVHHVYMGDRQECAFVGDNRPKPRRRFPFAARCWIHRRLWRLYQSVWNCRSGRSCWRRCWWHRPWIPAYLLTFTTGSPVSTTLLNHPKRSHCRLVDHTPFSNANLGLNAHVGQHRLGGFGHDGQLEPLGVAADNNLQRLTFLVHDSVAVAVGVAGLGISKLLASSGS